MWGTAKKYSKETKTENVQKRREGNEGREKDYKKVKHVDKHQHEKAAKEKKIVKCQVQQHEESAQEKKIAECQVPQHEETAEEENIVQSQGPEFPPWVTEDIPATDFEFGYDGPLPPHSAVSVNPLPPMGGPFEEILPKEELGNVESTESVEQSKKPEIETEQLQNIPDSFTSATPSATDSSVTINPQPDHAAPDLHPSKSTAMEQETIPCVKPEAANLSAPPQQQTASLDRFAYDPTKS